jgi:hypothetical protein
LEHSNVKWLYEKVYWPLIGVWLFRADMYRLWKRAKREAIQHRREREAYGLPAFHANVPRITAAYLAEADDLLDPCIHFDADTGEVAIVERIELAEHYGGELIPLGNESWSGSSVVVIQSATKVISNRIVDPRRQPESWASYV